MKLRFWDKTKEKFLSIKEVEHVMGGKPFFIQGYFGIELKTPFELVLYSGFNDHTTWDELDDVARKEWTDSRRKKEDWVGYELYDGDIIVNKNDVKWLINFDTKANRFEQVRIGGPGEVFEMRHNTKKLIGNKFRNPDLLK